VTSRVQFSSVSSIVQTQLNAGIVIKFTFYRQEHLKTKIAQLYNSLNWFLVYLMILVM